jgi:hypothetical protein
VTEPPAAVEELARRRSAARAERDYAAADALRDEIADAGWSVEDRPDGGWHLTEKATDAVLPDLGAVERWPTRHSGRAASVDLVVEGWPDDVRRCLDALVRHLPAGVGVTVLDAGDVDGAGTVADGFAGTHGDVVEVLHLRDPAPFGPARLALLRRDPAPVHIWLEPSTVLDGDALGPLLAALADPDVVGAGWRGVDVDADWTGFHGVGPGEADAILGYLFAMRRDAALAVAEDPGAPLHRARFYRNADLDLSFRLRETGGRLVAIDVPVQQTRHRGYRDSDPAVRERESSRNYRAFLARFRGREDLRTRPADG